MITVIGLGPMGQAMVRSLRKAGQEVTVWNRTASRAEGLGATIAPTVAEALAASELVILSLTDYKAMYDILGGETIGGKVIVNLSSDTPDKTRAAARWAEERGATLIGGGVMVPAELVGTDKAYVFYSGPEDLIRQYEPQLGIIGAVRYVGTDPALGQLFYQAQLDIFLTALASYLHATALVEAAGVPAAEYLPYAVENFDMVSYYLPEALKHIEEGKYPGDAANVIMMGATADHIVGASNESGVDSALPYAVKSMYDRAIAKGHGRDNWTSLYEVVKSAAADRPAQGR
ncbi:NAD(P)-dependent oxidoreductase [Kibdelosporangium phytohabitans]|uniref:6-phosphogluconate dehydrogenase n=1 Tax=Kibdelosporangium phytohabitans TaxID=860235 RepID=A0A0N9HVE1_9PSEU|nr:NAD(P)-binding domain-containing protein [Kibdelosporangium phytohabitans]ALG06157.1 6-phosphogluconate dehydrogenase [Kibdelosporangium phytohabitans]MBE1465749.1 3-hydroxyisobutyrate dehydrogenase-like beta-hydroxyacid dehydrogenase [Kibdelosporangium phytohabitans]